VTDSLPVIRLPQWSLLRFIGPDAQNFLHGQLTCDVLALKTGSSCYGGYCTPKGRLLATFLLWADTAGYTMMLPAALAAAIHKRLKMYILRSKVQTEELTPALACIGVAGADTARQITALGGTVPPLVHGVETANDITVIALPINRYLVITPQAPTTAAADASAWDALDIAAGIPFIQPATQEEFVAQMVNLDLIGGLSYTKGCYPGQEIIARTHYLGRLKQRMFLARVDATATAGDKLYSADLGEQSSGMIIAGVPMGDGQHDVLAVMQTATAGNTPYHLGSPQGPALQLGVLPYKII
jgi:tRNA-modifying protein YgfZ